MKSAEQWNASEWAVDFYKKKSRLSIIQQIQRDAWQQGMTDAAAIVSEARGENGTDFRPIQASIEIARGEARGL